MTAATSTRSAGSIWRRRRWVIVVALMLSALLPFPVPSTRHDAAAATPNPLTCVGYPEPRVFLESQTWWIQTPGKTGTTFGHMHVGACVPTERTVSGVVGIDVRIILHDNPGKFDYWNPVLVSDTQELSLPHVTDLHGLTCPSGTCAAWSHADVDTRQLDYDGRQELRIRAYTNTPDGNIMHSSINAFLDLANGKTANPLDRRAYQRGKGWYTGSGYCEASFLSAIPYGPLSGTWAPTVLIADHGAADDLAVTHHTIRIDPDFHADPPKPGTIISDGPGQLASTTLSIDTRALANGVHKLHMRADCNDPRGSTNSGVLIVPFTVDNGSSTDDTPPTVVPPASRLRAGARLGVATTPVRTTWAATDASGVASYSLERQVDAGSWTPIALPTATSSAIWPGLAFGHLHQYRVRATDGHGNTSVPLSGVRFKPLLTQQSSTSVVYAGTWRTVRTSIASGGTLRYATGRGASARYTFAGSGVAWVTVKGPNRGSARVYVDGVYRATVSLYARTYTSRAIAYAANWSANGRHSIRIVVVGTAGHPRVDVDGFVRLYQS
jgi:hypothetical protein